MLGPADDARQLRNRDYEDLGYVSPDRCSPSASMLVQTVTQTTYPTAAARVYAVMLAQASVTESEGSTPTYTTYGSIFWAVNLGNSIPATGTTVPARAIDGLIVFNYG